MFPGPRSRETLRSGYGSQPGCHQIQGRRLFNPSAKRHQQQGPRLSMRPPYHAGRPPLTRRGHHGVRRGVRPGFQTPAGGPRKSRLTFAPQTQSPGQWGEHPGMPPPAAWRPRELLTHLRARLPQRPRFKRQSRFNPRETRRRTRGRAGAAGQRGHPDGA